ncbi:cyclase family protein [Pseudonocardia ailaonensis]|uniref:cyclase family protein n=1 Tax=Pseudonocardia ailaonensis TaxID=367279 RepID=UPI0031E085D2
MVEPCIDDVRRIGESCSNWGRWGTDDELGTLNLITPESVRAGAATVELGEVISLGLPYNSAGPQTGGFGRFNPIHMMIRDGNDALAGTTPRDFYKGRDAYIRSADDIIIMPLQCGTQWDALSHIMYDGTMYNGIPASEISSLGARKSDITVAQDKMTGRGVLLDIARWRGVDSLEPGFVIGRAELEGCAAAQGTEVRAGDFVLVRTGQVGEVRRRGAWEDYAGGDAPGLGLSAPEWLHEHDVAGVATDTWGMEVLPNETKDVFQPLHIILIVYMGLWVGEIFDLEGLGTRCAEIGRREFLFSAPPLPITYAVGSPVNPQVVL